MVKEREIKQHIPHDCLERCPICKQYLLHKQIKDHKCNNHFNSVKEVPVIFFYQTTETNGNKSIIARGFDGVLYKMIKCNKPNLKKILSDEKKHLNDSDGEVTEPSKVIFKGG